MNMNKKNREVEIVPFKSMTTYEASRALGVTIRTVQVWVEKGLIRGWKTPGGHRRVNVAEVEKLVLERRKKKLSYGGMNDFRVLVIEDEPDVCQLYALMFRSWDIPLEVQFASDGLQGLIKFGEFKPDFTIVDMNIPLLDGAQIIKSLQSTLSVEASRICVISGMDHDLLNKSGAIPQQVTLLGKPIDFDILRQKIEAVIAEVKSEIRK